MTPSRSNRQSCVSPFPALYADIGSPLFLPAPPPVGTRAIIILRLHVHREALSFAL